MFNESRVAVRLADCKTDQDEMVIDTVSLGIELKKFWVRTGTGHEMGQFLILDLSRDVQTCLTRQ